jgi:hypothetical protein
MRLARPIRTSGERDIAEGSLECFSRRFRDCDRAGRQSPRPARQARFQSRFEPMTGTLETLVTLAAVQLAIRRLART